MITLPCEACGWKAVEPSRIQAEVALDKHRRLSCPNHTTCSVCTEIGPGKVRPLDEKDKTPRFVCDRCWDEHPRQGGYSFDHGRDPSRVSIGRKSGKRKK